ncbi:MAG: sulfatase [Acidobacteriota bacterium]
MKNNTILIFVIILLLLVPGCTKKRTKTLEELPNIVLIIVDTLRADHLPFYGYKENTTPFLNKIAEKSTVFNRTFAASSWTAPSTASIFTSLYPFQHKVLMNMLATITFNLINPDFSIKLNRIPQEIVTLGEVFKEKGYSTFGFADNTNIGKKESFDQGFDTFVTFNYKKGENLNRSIIEHSEEIKKSKRYFMYVHYMDPHQPNAEREAWFKTRTLKKVANKNIKNRDNKEKIYNENLLYDSEINFTDSKIEELFKLFNWDKNTLFVFSADHGEELWDHGRWGHGYSLYNEVIRVPLFFYYPGGNFKSGNIRQNVSTIDILPTFREFIGLNSDSVNEGVSLLDLLENGEKKNVNGRYIYSHLVEKRMRQGKPALFESYGVIQDNMVYIRTLPGKKMRFKKLLFDINSDFGQKKNLYESSGNEAEKLKAVYLKFRKSSKKFKQDISNYKSNKKEMEKLKTLGYIDGN